MKKYILFLYLAVSTTLITQISCSSFFFNYEPIWMITTQNRDTSQVALLCGQAYMKSYGNWIQAHVKSVDGKNVFNNITDRPTTMVYVTPGKHKITILGALGSYYSGYRHKNPPTLDIDVLAGEAYQLDFDIYWENNKPKSSSYKLIHIGTIKQALDYINSNTEYKKGMPIPSFTNQKTTP